jgi:hypothetical protein
MSCELVAIFEQNIGAEKQPQIPSQNAMVLHNDADAYWQRKMAKNKPLPPSQQAIVDYYAGDKSPNKIIKTFFARSVLIGSALFIFGDNKNQNALIKNSLVASASIECFLLYWYKIKNK